MDWRKELKQQLGVLDEIAATGLDDMEDCEFLTQQHLKSLQRPSSAKRDISNGFFQAIREEL